MQDIALPVEPPVFPPNYCFAPQQYANDLASGLIVSLPGTVTPWNIGPNAPTTSLRDRPWRKIDPVTGVSVGDFDWSPLYGKWLKQHFHNGAPFYQFVPTSVSLDTFDGGEAGAVTPIAGPFWKQYTSVSPVVTSPTGCIFIERTTRVFDRA